MDSTNSPLTTPKFLLWAIPQSCPIKDTLECAAGDHVDLLQLERTFRPLRSISSADAENRVIDEICILQDRSMPNWSLDDVKGFSAAETMDAFGGEEFLQSNCESCSANVYRSVDAQIDGTKSQMIPRRFAGCYGYLQSTYDGWDLFQWWQEQLNSDSSEFERETGFQLDEIWRTRNENGHWHLNRQTLNFFEAVSIDSGRSDATCRLVEPDFRPGNVVIQQHGSSDSGFAGGANRGKKLDRSTALFDLCFPD